MPDQDLTFGPFRLDALAQQLIRGEEAIPLQPKVMAALELFLERPGELVTREELDEALWPGVVVVSGALFQIIRKLRRALDDDPSAPTFVQTVPRRGYRWIAEVHAPSSPAPAAAPAPPPPADLVGRDGELGELAAWLHAPTGFVTLTGFGGVGKTTLARALLRTHAGDAAFVDLTTAGDEGQVRARAVEALGLDLDAVGRDPDVLWRALGARPGLLLVVDNAEGAVEAVGRFVTQALGVAPGLAVLVTSRVPLQIAHERVVEVGPLADASGLELLARRARRPVADDPAAQRLVQRLDGLPLALELAAQRLALLSPAQLMQRLDHDRSLLRSRHRDTPERHASLDWVLQSTWLALEASEQRALAACTVFAGGFSVEDAEAVLGPDALFELEALHEAGLVRRGQSGRLRLLAVVREFAAERLVELDAEAEAIHAHVDWFDRRGGARARAHFRGEASAHGLLHRDAENLWAAWHRSGESAWGAALGLLAINGRGATQAALEHLAEAAARGARSDDELMWALLAQAVVAARGARWLDVIRLSSDAERVAREQRRQRIAVLAAERRGRALVNLGRYAEASALFADLHDQARALGDDKAEFAVVRSWALADQQQGAYDTAQQRLRHALALGEQSGHPDLAVLLLNLSEIVRNQGGLDEAGQLLARAQDVAEATGAQRLSQVMSARGGWAWDTGDVRAAEDLTRRGLDHARRMGSAGELPLLLGQLGEILVSQGRLVEGRAHLEASLREAERQGRAATLTIGRFRLVIAELIAGAPHEAERHLGQLAPQEGLLAGYVEGHRAMVAMARGRDPGPHLERMAEAIPADHAPGRAMLDLLGVRASGAPTPPELEHRLETGAWLRLIDAAVTRGSPV